MRHSPLLLRSHAHSNAHMNTHAQMLTHADTDTHTHACTRAHTHTHARTRAHTHTHTHTHTYEVVFGESDFASVTGDTILPHFPVCIHMIIPIYLAMNVRVQRKKHKKQQSDFSPGSGDKIECSNKRRGHPIPCVLPLD